MRILFLAPQPFFSNRGTPIAVRAAVEALAADGHEIDLLTYFDGEDVTIPGVRIFRIARPPFVHSVPIGISWQKVPCDLAMWWAARRLAKAGEYDVVHAVEEAAFIGLVLNRALGIPYVFDMDSRMSGQIEERSRWLRPLAYVFAALERLAIRRSAGVLAVCSALVDYARPHQPRDNVALLPDMPMNTAGAPESQELAAIKGTKIVYVGNLETYQGIQLLLEGFELVQARHPEARLVIIGGSSAHIEMYRARAGRLSDQGRVLFLGPRPIEKLGEFLAAADILVSPRTQGENTPMKIYSYMDAAKPILATRRLTHTQVLDDDVACLVASTAEAMAEGLDRLLADPELRARLGTAARALVRREYSQARFRQRLADFYATLAHPNSVEVTSQS